jgi:hypothetical protein
VADYVWKSKTSQQGIAQENTVPSYWSQYKRTHDYLGAKLGTGEPRELPDRKAYNILNCKLGFHFNKKNKRKIIKTIIFFENRGAGGETRLVSKRELQTCVRKCKA